MLSWLVTRHLLYMMVVWSCVVESKQLNSFHAIDWSRGDVFSEGSYATLIGLLCGLQVILLIWFTMILKVAYRVLTKAGATDSRSDDESSLEEEDTESVPTGSKRAHGQEGQQEATAAATATATETASSAAAGQSKPKRRGGKARS